MFFVTTCSRTFASSLSTCGTASCFSSAKSSITRLTATRYIFICNFRSCPAHEHDWSLVQVALTDITARKKAEAYLEYLGQHDVLTKLYNRSFYVDELNRPERKGPFPVTIIVADLNGLKAANDQWGHAAGDALLRRAGE